VGFGGSVGRRFRRIRRRARGWSVGTRGCVVEAAGASGDGSLGFAVGSVVWGDGVVGVPSGADDPVVFPPPSAVVCSTAVRSAAP
jgi:hypothetical protein